MKKLISYSFILLLAGGIFTSCVPKRKLLSSQQWVQQLQSDSASCHNTLNDCNATVKKLQEQKSSLQDANAAAANDLANLSSKSKLTIAEQAKRLQSLQDLIQAQRDVMSRLKKSITDALINFKADELSVYIKDGKVYVSLSEKLLFKSGSAVVDPKGKEALASLAKVLNSTKDISVMIEGHTDTIPIKNAKFEDNWSLSVSRATSIVRILSTDYGFDAHRIIASGRSEFYPVKANSTPEGRAVNRRTEIILSPDLNELFRLLDQ
ncbi:MAG: flagellar motor protein MotB [Bacteroidia bacterium]